MTGCIEFGKCDYCGKETTVQRKYYHYDIKCDCHSPNHFEIRRNVKTANLEHLMKLKYLIQ